MSEHCGYIVKVENLRPHSNADRLQIATFFGNDTCVGLDVKQGDIGIYFPTDLQLSVEYCEANNLVRKKDAEGNNIGGYMDPDKRNVKTIKLRGEKSDGIYMPINSLASFGDISTLSVGTHVDVFNGHEICCKYIPRGNEKGPSGERNRKRKEKKIAIAPLFMEHADTEQLAYNLDAFKEGDQIEITLKMHGTSQRTGYLPIFKKYKRSIFDRIFRREGTPIYDWGYVSGTRRTVLENYEGGFYGSNAFREDVSKFFEGKLRKGEEVFYEVVGYVNETTPIMSEVDNKKTQDKEFVKQYGKTTVFSYGCEPGQHDFYVYRMTMTNEDGDVVEYPPDFMRYRCEQMGCKTVPVLDRFIITPNLPGFFVSNAQTNPAGEYVQRMAELYYDGPDPIGKTHVREGVVCRIVNRPKFTAYKHKNFNFKVLEGIAKVEAEAPDIEEAQEVLDEEVSIQKKDSSD